MKGKWKVTMNPMMGDRKYGVCRLRDIDRPDHSGNREYAQDWYESRKDAERMAILLNGEAHS